MNEQGKPEVWEECLLGFDARKMSAACDEIWNKERRSRFLIRTDAEKILSTDTMVWPSAFGMPVKSYTPEGLRLPIFTEGPRIPDELWTGMNGRLWEDLEVLNDFLETHSGALQKPYLLLAVTCEVSLQRAAIEDRNQKQGFGPWLGRARPDVANLGWTCLGYDVSDWSMISGLTNCGYTPDEISELNRKGWTKKLNENHLFSTIEAAHEFRRYTDLRVKEHAPFFVYGMYTKGAELRR
jgi:hypothetical protein